MYPSSIVPVEYPTRLLRLSLAHLSPLLDPKGQAVPAAAADSSSSKKGKKRARGAEDGLVGGLEGRDRVNLTEEEVHVIVESLKCTSPACTACTKNGADFQWSHIPTRLPSSPLRY
jgi:hypothetical protein